MSNRPSTAPLRRAISRTRDGVAIMVRRRRARFVFGSVTAGYLLAYLWAIGHLAFGLGGYGIRVVDHPIPAFFRPALGPFTFTPVALVRLGPVTYLFSLNSVLGLGLAVLVGSNVALTSLVWTQRRACNAGESWLGVVASLPALFSGTACCAPVVLLVVGVQASSVLLTAVQFLLPVAAVLLIGSLLLVGRRIDPAAV
ncbi:MAG: hypothetical protein ABEI80_10265 [Haloplanus sp.]